MKDCGEAPLSCPDYFGEGIGGKKGCDNFKCTHIHKGFIELLSYFLFKASGLTQQPKIRSYNQNEFL
jgi:hypothetical protein